MLPTIAGHSTSINLTIIDIGGTVTVATTAQEKNSVKTKSKLMFSMPFLYENPLNIRTLTGRILRPC